MRHSLHFTNQTQPCRLNCSFHSIYLFLFTHTSCSVLSHHCLHLHNHIIHSATFVLKLKFIHWRWWLPCKVPTSTSGIWTDFHVVSSNTTQSPNTKARDHCSRQRFSFCKWETTGPFNMNAVDWINYAIKEWMSVQLICYPTLWGRRSNYVRYMQSQRKDYHGSLSHRKPQSELWKPLSTRGQSRSSHCYWSTSPADILWWHYNHFLQRGNKKSAYISFKNPFHSQYLLEDLDWESVYIVKVINDAQLKAVFAWFHIIIVAER